MYLGKHLTVLALSLSNHKSHLVLRKSCSSHRGLEPPPDGAGLVLASHQGWRRRDEAVKGHQHHAALPCCAGEAFGAGPHGSCLCRSLRWAEARTGTCSQPAAPPSLPLPREMPWTRRCKGLACLGWGDPAEGGCLQALAVSNVAAHKWKQFWVKNNVVVSFVVFLAVSGLGGPRAKDSNLSEAKCGSWN